MYDIHTIIGRSPEKPDSGKAASIHVNEVEISAYIVQVGEPRAFVQPGEARKPDGPTRTGIQLATRRSQV